MARPIAIMHFYYNFVHDILFSIPMLYRHFFFNNFKYSWVKFEGLMYIYVHENAFDARCGPEEEGASGGLFFTNTASL